jgi:hypothetical protein
MTFRVYKNVHLPPRSKYPFDHMDIGDTFYYPCNRYFRNNEQCKIHNAARRYRKRYNLAFRIETISAEHAGEFAIAVRRTH